MILVGRLASGGGSGPPPAPSIAYVSPQTLQVDVPGTIAPFPDAEPGDTHAVTFGSIPSGTTLDVPTGVVDGTPDTLDEAGSFKVTRTRGLLSAQSNLVTFNVSAGVPALDYTTIPPLPAGAINVFVSESVGSNAFDGLTTSTPKANWYTEDLDSAYFLMRVDVGDRMLLRRGDTWSPFGETSNPLNIHGGAAADEPQMLWSYADDDSIERPVILGIGVRIGYNATTNHAWVVGIHVEGTTEAHPTWLVGISCEAARGSDVLVEDCFVSLFSNNVQCNPTFDTFDDFRIRRCVIYKAYSDTVHAQGAFTALTSNVLIQGNVFDHNGWNEDVSGAGKSQFNHSMYIYPTVESNGAVITYNLNLRPSSFGCPAQTYALNAKNYYLECAYGSNIANLTSAHSFFSSNVLDGSSTNGSAGGTGLFVNLYPDRDDFPVDVNDNLFMGNTQSEGGGDGAIALGGTSTTKNARVYDNVSYKYGPLLNISGGTVFASGGSNLVEDNQATGVAGYAGYSNKLFTSVGANNYADISFARNIWFSYLSQPWWDVDEVDKTTYLAFAAAVGEVDGGVLAPSYSDPTRCAATYDSAVLGGPGTNAHFCDTARLLSKLDPSAGIPDPLDPLNYARAGFNMAPVS